MHKLLIVEDEDILRQAYVNVFKMEGFNVAEAANGEVALEQIEKFLPDVVILDILMPIMDGIEFLEKVNLVKKYPKTKVLVLSNLSDKETVDHVITLGAARHLVKSSLSPSQLVKTVRALLTYT
jgi:DNA-binding NarL/FixJ family response regulator